MLKSRSNLQLILGVQEPINAKTQGRSE